MSDSMANFSAMVAGGGVGVNEHGGQALIRAIDTMQDGIAFALRQSFILGQEPPLGTTPAAQVYKPYLATIATDPVQGFIAAAMTFKQDLEAFRGDVERAMAAYRAVDDGEAQNIKKSGGPVLSA